MLNARLTINVKTRVETERFLLSVRIMEIEGPNYRYQIFYLYICSFRLFTNTASLSTAQDIMRVVNVMVS